MKFREFVKEQIAIIKDRDPAMKADREVFLYPSFWALWEYQRAHKYVYVTYKDILDGQIDEPWYFDPETGLFETRDP